MAEESRFVVFARASLLNVGHSQLRLAHQSQQVEWKAVLLRSAAWLFTNKRTFNSSEGCKGLLVISLIITFIWPINEGCERQLLLIIWKNVENAFISQRWPCASFKQSTNSIWPSFCLRSSPWPLSADEKSVRTFNSELVLTTGLGVRTSKNFFHSALWRELRGKPGKSYQPESHWE